MRILKVNWCMLNICIHYRGGRSGSGDAKVCLWAVVSSGSAVYTFASET